MNTNIIFKSVAFVFQFVPRVERFCRDCSACSLTLQGPLVIVVEHFTELRWWVRRYLQFAERHYPTAAAKYIDGKIITRVADARHLRGLPGQ